MQITCLDGSPYLLFPYLRLSLWNVAVICIFCQFTTAFVDTLLWKTKHPQKRFQNLRQSCVLSTDRIEIHQSCERDVIGGFRCDLSITRKTDGYFGNVSAGVLKWYYDENHIFSIEAILGHKQVACVRRKMLFTIFKYRFFFMQISLVMTSYTQPSFDQI